LAGLRAAQLTRDVAIGEMRRYAEAARGDGRSWDDIAAASGIEPSEDGEPRDERAFRLIIEGRQLEDDEGRYRSSRPVARWTCGSCGQWISDRGPFESRPEDNEDGHSPECPRQRAQG
ncbi:MAG: hypothetical protein L0K86_14520, partial [Actinomycetia bacterium]|nr:hypothetical protein [Actinomycetes bacterium]